MFRVWYDSDCIIGRTSRAPHEAIDLEFMNLGRIKDFKVLNFGIGVIKFVLVVLFLKS